MTDVTSPTATGLAPARQRLHDIMQATLADEAAHHDWYYHAVRPCAVPATWRPGQIVVGDCSKGVQMLAHWANAPDPMGNGFGPYGNSQTIWLKLQHLDHASLLEIGDIITFGSWGAEHAAMVLVPGDNPRLWSFGHQGAPNTYHLSADRRPAQFLRLPIVYVPTPADRLRARTGWFAWVAWRLGEGDWRHWGPHNAKVRPDVPAKIPNEWWARYLLFVANRRRGG